MKLTHCDDVRRRYGLELRIIDEHWLRAPSPFLRLELSGYGELDCDM